MHKIHFSKNIWDTFVKTVSELQASEWVFPMAAVDWHLKASVARSHAVNFIGALLNGAGHNRMN